MTVSIFRAGALAVASGLAFMAVPNAIASHEPGATPWAGLPEMAEIRALREDDDLDGALALGQKLVESLAPGGEHASLAPEARAEILVLHARTVEHLGMYAWAAGLYTRAIDEVGRYNYDNPARLNRLLGDLAMALKAAGNREQAEIAYRRALAATGGGGPETSLHHARNLVDYGIFLIDAFRYQEAEPLLVQARRHLERDANPTDPRLLLQVNELLALSYRGMGEHEAALKAAAAASDAALSLGSTGQPHVSRMLGLQASILARLGRDDDAVELYRDTLVRSINR